jgi:CBS domain-containing protein
MNRRTLLHSPNGPLQMPGSQRDYACVGPAEPASLVMTDFRTGPMITTAVSASIELALQQMKLSGARFAFVVDGHGALVGSVTSYDIQGEKPIRYMQSIDGSHTTTAWRDVTVENIMEPLPHWQVLHHADVARLTIGDVAELMSDVGLRYLVVVERPKDNDNFQVRGLFSGARIQVPLGTAATGLAAAQTFAELERAIV